ncbi:MAG: VOC family protein [Myxococcota bacterium]
MMPIGEGFGRVVQVAYLVEDIDAAMGHWLRHAGLGPWTCFRNIELDTEFEGRRFTMRIHEALAYAGELQIQLVQSLDDAGAVTPYRDFVRSGRFGVHHVAFFAEDVEAAVERAKRQGFERICAMRDKGGYRYYYCESKAMPGVWIELLESYPALHDIFEQGIAAAANWDGRDPIRNFEYSEL